MIWKKNTTLCDMRNNWLSQEEADYYRVMKTCGNIIAVLLLLMPQGA
jgi:hypothetical protein